MYRDTGTPDPHPTHGGYHPAACSSVPAARRNTTQHHLPPPLLGGVAGVVTAATWAVEQTRARARKTMARGRGREGLASTGGKAQVA